MRVLNIIDIVFYRTFLAKIYFTVGVQYDFVSPEDEDIEAVLTTDPPDAVLIQDSYMEETDETVFCGNGNGGFSPDGTGGHGFFQ